MKCGVFGVFMLGAVMGGAAVAAAAACDPAMRRMLGCKVQRCGNKALRALGHVMK